MMSFNGTTRGGRFWLIGLVLIAGMAVSQSAARAQSSAPEPLSAFPKSVLAIQAASGHVLNFLIWNADRPSREEQGLMFVRHMDDHEGMLFVFPGGQRVSMWMKNTYISLDMLFIGADGRIEYIAPRTIPLSLTIISAPNPARAVLELKGGISEQLGIHVGDVVVNANLSTTR
jgi:uncharacterized protein